MKKKSLKKLLLQKKAIANLDTTIGGTIPIDQTGLPGSICEPMSLCNTQCASVCEVTMCHQRCGITANKDECTVVSPTLINL